MPKSVQEKMKILRNSPVKFKFYGEEIEIKGVEVDQFPEVFKEFWGILTQIMEVRKDLTPEQVENLDAAGLVKLLTPVLFPLMGQIKVFLGKALDIDEKLLGKAKVSHVLLLLTVFIEQNELEYVLDFFGIVQKMRQKEVVSQKP